MKRLQYRIGSVLTYLVLGSMQVWGQAGGSVSPNRYAVSVRLSHLYDLSFQPNKTLPSGFKAEDMKGLNGDNTRFDLAYGLGFTYYFGPLISVDVAADFGSMSGSGEYEYYSAKVSMLRLGTNVSLKPLNRRWTNPLTPYARISLGTGWYDAQRKFIEDQQQFESTKGNCLQLGFGAGVRYHYSANWSISLQSEFVTNYTDAWDGYDNSMGNDHLIQTSLGVNYTFGNGTHADQQAFFNPVQPGQTAFKSNQDSLQNVRLQQVQDSLTALNKKLADSQNRILDHKKQQEEQTNVVVEKAVVPDLNALKQMTKIELNTIYFRSGSSQLTEAAIRQLNIVARILLENEGLVVDVFGYTDASGSERRNKRLAHKRANKVIEFLVKKGIHQERFTAHVEGEKNHIDNRPTRAAFANNRRVEFRVSIE